MDPELLEKAIVEYISKGKKPKAIVLVHLYGMPSKMDELMSIANKYDIPVIEDAAEALGSSYRGQTMGSFGDISVFSFNGNKIITTSSGGALLSKDKEVVEKSKFLATQARDTAPYYQHSELGYNYRMSNVLAGIGRGQMSVLDERVSQRRAHFEAYKLALGEYDCLSFHEEFDDVYSNRWLTCLTFDTAKVDYETLRQYLEEFNIESRPLWKPMHKQPLYQEYDAYLNGVSEDLFSRGLCLPSGSNMSLDQRKFVITKIKAFLDK